MRLDISDNIFEVKQPEIDFKGAGISLVRDIIGPKETISIIEKLGDFINLNSARVVSVIVADLLASAQPRVPVDTGELRESGRATLIFKGRSYKDIAKGKKDGSVEVDHSRVTLRDLKNVTEITGNVSYSRLSKDFEGTRDVAQWTHEYLNYYGEESPAARKPGTGPKYLESAWNESKNDYFHYLTSELTGIGFETALSRVLQKKTKKEGLYELNYTDIVLSRTAWF